MTAVPSDSSSDSDLSLWPSATALVITGHTAADFLQGYLTCDTTRIQPNTPIPMALCNVKGRVVASGWAIAVSDNETVGVALVVHQTVDSALRRFLKPYVTFSNCQMLDDPWPVQIKHQGSGSTLEAAPGYNLLVAASAPSTAVDQGLVNKFETALIEQRFAFVDDAVTGQFLPQMLALDDSRAVDFDKGCYLGQEIVARAQFRGQVKRQLDTFEWHGERPSPGDTWADRGTVIQTVQTDGEGANRGIGHAVLPV